MSLLVVSNILLWVGFITMVLISLLQTRQIGVLCERIAPAGALSMNQKLRVGDKAPELTVTTLDNSIEKIGGGPRNKSQLLFFLSPDCPICNELTPALKSAAKSESGWLDVMLASDGEHQGHAEYITGQGLNNFPYAVSELLGKTFGVFQLPYGVLIDEQGRIAAMGIINSREHLDSLFEAKERQVASIQDYMKQQSGG